MEIILTWLLLTVAWIRPNFKTSLRTQILSCILGAIVSTCLIYFLQIPTLTIVIIPLVALMIALNNFIAYLMDSDNNMLLFSISVLVIAFYGSILLFEDAYFSTDLYRIPQMKEVQNGSAKEIIIRTPGSGTTSTSSDLAKEIISSNHIRTVPKEAAEWKADKTIGEYGFKFQTNEAHIQFRDGELKWLVPFEYDGDYKAWVYGDEGINGYASVSAENPQKNPERVFGYKMKYVPSAVFGYNLQRRIYFEYPGYYQKESVFQLNDVGKPIYVTMLTKPTIWYSGEVPVGVVITDTETGDMEFYEMDKIPPYIERVMDESLTEQYLIWWGGNVHGFWNTVFSQKDMKKPTGSLSMTTAEGGETKISSSGTPDVYLVYGTDNRLYWFTSITNIGRDLSMVGYTLTDVFSGNTTFYQTEGYFNDIAAAKNVQQHADVSKVMGYHVSQPIMYVIDGSETWIIPVLASTNEVKAFGIVHGKSGTTFVREKLSDVLSEYRVWLSGTTPRLINTQRFAEDVVAILVIQNELDKREIPVYKNTTILIRGRD